MEDYLKIKVSIADRVYPLNIKRSEEEKIRLAAKKIDSLLKKYEENYAVRDKQDLLAMCALQLASRIEKNTDKLMVDGDQFEEELKAMKLLIEHVIQ